MCAPCCRSSAPSDCWASFLYPVLVPPASVEWVLEEEVAAAVGIYIWDHRGHENQAVEAPFVNLEVAPPLSHAEGANGNHSYDRREQNFVFPS